MRLEPFTTLHVELQSGHFDHADRLFHSVAGAWRSATSASYDVKELIPEFYCNPEFLKNPAGITLGARQDGTALGPVVLPPWAKTPEDFVATMRDALESEHVSAHLHEWVDLVFGCNQRGQRAADARNLFYYTSYEGEVDPLALTDAHQRKVFEDQVTHFGQTPMQLFKEPHPPRGPAVPVGPGEVAVTSPLRHQLPVGALAFDSAAAAADGPLAVFSADTSGVVVCHKLAPRAARLALDATDADKPFEGADHARTAHGTRCPCADPAVMLR